MTTITLRGLEKRWGQVVGVHPMDLEVADREFLVLLGLEGEEETGEKGRGRGDSYLLG